MIRSPGRDKVCAVKDQTAAGRPRNGNGGVKVNARRRLGGLEFHVKRDREGFSFNIKTDPEYQQAREEVFRLVDQAVAEARRSGVTVAEILAYLARKNRRNPPAASE
jgi:hypothetical protein